MKIFSGCKKRGMHRRWLTINNRDFNNYSKGGFMKKFAQSAANLDATAVVQPQGMR
jgi:hypothetical protein